MPPTTLVLLGNRRRLLLPALQAARACGVVRRVVVGNAGTRRLRWSTACNRHVLADLDDDAAVLACLQALAREFPQAVLAPGDCEATCLLDRLRAELPLRTIPLATTTTIDLLDDKARFHAFCVLHGLPVPLSVTLPGREALDFAALAAAVGLPLVVKPTRCSGSQGVVVVRSLRDLELHVLGDKSYPLGELVVQHFIEGSDIDVDLFADGGRLLALAVHSVDGHVMAFSRHAVLEELAAALCRLSGYSGPMNIDARLEAGTGDVYLIETNPRFWASMAAPMASGMNFMAEGLRTDGDAAVTRFLPPGQVDTRHPLLRPAAWWPLLAGRGEHGRMLRSLGLDPYGLAVLAGQLPAIARRAMRRLRGAAARALRPREARTAPR
jgi:predicted ATP-grasp superfamily ATP-dependent carboligase